MPVQAQVIKQPRDVELRGFEETPLVTRHLAPGAYMVFGKAGIFRSHADGSGQAAAVCSLAVVRELGRAERTAGIDPVVSSDETLVSLRIEEPAPQESYEQGDALTTMLAADLQHGGTLAMTAAGEGVLVHGAELIVLSVDEVKETLVLGADPRGRPFGGP
jgi:hypothetical protein